ncbi:hypothetical protein HID58_033568 [Brassica napus]|uniref:Uncharacterized protein n=1 Tax=Brassica napus TaxID=3708 RepID=A0ABQ8BZL6_BRANA|nr:hypothetical protein HID58_033568 [Brassica napus]
MNNEAETIQENNNPRKEVFVIKHRRSHERSKTTKTKPERRIQDDEDDENQEVFCIQEELRLRQERRRRQSRCGRQRRGRRSRAADSSAAARRRRVASGAEETDSEQRRERKRRTPSREREDSKSYRSGSTERGSGSRRVSRSPERRSETTNPDNGIGSSVNSSNNNNIPAKFVSVPATDKEKRSSNNNADASIKRVAVKRNVASPRSQSPARAASPRAQSPARMFFAPTRENWYDSYTISYTSAPFGDYIASPLLLNIHGYKKLFLQTRVMYSILIHLNGQCVSEGGSKKTAENGFMTGGGCNSSSSRVGRQTWSKLWSRSCNAALETNQCWVDKECLKHLKRSKSQDSYTTEEVRHKSWKW